MQSHNALVTGANGFIGRHLVSTLIARGAKVAALTRVGTSVPEEWTGKAATLRCDDWSEQGLRRSLAEHSFETVYHLAAYGVRPDDREIAQMVQINVNLPMCLVRLCKEWGAHLVMAGTFSEYQRPHANEPLKENAPLETLKLYGATKAAGGLIASATAQQLNVGLRLLRLFKVYGAGEAKHRLLPAIVSGLRRNEKVGMSSGSQILDFVYIDDIVEAFLRAAQHVETTGGICTWNVSTGQGHSVREFALKVASAMRCDPDLLGFGQISMRHDDEPWLVGDPACMRRALRWSPNTELDQGICSAVAQIV